MGQLIGAIFNPHGPIFQFNFITAINDAYWLTFWLSIATLLLAFTLPGRPKLDKTSGEGEEAAQAATVEDAV